MLGAAFVRERFTASTRLATETLVKDIRHAFEASLEDTQWLDAKTRERVGLLLCVQCALRC